MTKNTVHFTVDSQLMGELGQRLVSKNYVALAELIKNCYDADATEVIISFKNVSKTGKQGEIKICDDGQGMSLETVKTKWMRVATTNKQTEHISPKYGRPRTGSKGIGRFACQKLAKTLQLETIGKSGVNLEKTFILFDWSKFVAGEDLTNVLFEYSLVNDDNSKTGTTLTLKNLTEEWTQSDFNTLKRNILSLSVAKGIKRKGYIQDPGMQIKIETDEFENKKENLLKEFMKAGWGNITGSIDAAGNAIVKLHAKDNINKEFSLPIEFKSLKGIKLDVQWIIPKSEHMRNTTLLKIRQVGDLLKEYGGIKVYFNNFRVYPYGEKGNDWLDIDKDQAKSKGIPDLLLANASKNIGVDGVRPLLYMPNNINLYGSVFIDGIENENFEIKIDREGFIEENTAYNELKRFVRLSIEWATLNYAAYMLKIKIKEDKLAQVRAKEFLSDVTKNNNVGKATFVSEAVKFIKDTIDKEMPKVPVETKEKIQVVSQFIEKSFEKKDVELTLLRNVASVNAIMLTFAHEAKDLVARLTATSEKLKNLNEPKNLKYDSQISDVVSYLLETRDRFSDQMALFGILAQSTSKLKESKVDVEEVIKKVNRSFSFVKVKYGIDVKIQVPEYIKTPLMYAPEVYTLVINLLSNAIKVVLASDEGKDIMIEAIRNKEGLYIRVYDQGIGLSPKYWDKVFEPLEADPENKLYSKLNNLQELSFFGQGTGLGLAIVKDIVNSRGGEVKFVTVKKPWVTCIEVKLP